MEALDFNDFLKQKKINSNEFQKAEPGQWEEFKSIYDQVHPDSFIAQKLFLINQIRRKYPYTEKPVAAAPATSAIARPKMPMKPKITR